MAKPDKAELKNQGIILKEIVAQARKKTLNFALLQGKDQMYLVTHLKKNPTMLRKEAKKLGGGPKAAMGTLNVESKNLIFSVEEEPPGPFPKLTKKHFMTRGLAMRVTFKLPDGSVIDDGEEDADQTGAAPTDDTKPDDENTTEPQDNAGAGILARFVALKDDLNEKMARASDDVRAILQDLSDRFESTHGDQEFEKSEGYLEDLQKNLEEKIEDWVEDLVERVGGLMALPADVQKKIDAILAIGVTQAELLEKTAEENAKKLVENIVKAVTEAKDLSDELLAPAAERIKQMLAALKEYQVMVARLDDFDLSDAQTVELAVLAKDNPKSFEAAIKTLKSMDDTYGDLDATPQGIEALVKIQNEVTVKTDLELKKLTALLVKAKTAKDAVEAAKKTQAEAQKKVAVAQAALVKLKAKLPSDLSTLSEAQKNALVTVINLLKANKTKLDTAIADTKSKEAVAKTADQVSSAQDILFWDLMTVRRRAEEVATAGKVKKKMLDSLEVGPLSPDSKDPLSDEDIAKVLSALEVDLEFGELALNVLETTKDKANVAKGAGLLGDGMTNGLKGDAGPVPIDKYYAQEALKMGEALGDNYFDDLEAFAAKGGLTKTTTLSEYLTPKKKLEQERAKYVGDAMLGADGKIDTTSPAATEALDMLKFHPSLLMSSTPGMNMHFADMAKTMDDPANKQKIQDVLDGITDAPTESTGRDIVAQSTGKASADVTADDTKAAVMSAMFTPLNQEQVGSCFATGPARNLRDKDPAKAMADMAEIATKGTLTTAQGVPIKAVRTSLGTSPADIAKNKLPADDNPLMRSWEYTIATAGGQLAGSAEELALDSQLWTTAADADPNGKNLNALGSLDGMTNWTKVKSDLKNLIHAELDFRYNATSDIEASADGSSINGNFEIFNNGGEFPPAGAITTKAGFIKIISSLAIKAAKAETNVELSAKITAHCSSQPFIDSVCLTKKGSGTTPDVIHKPWEIQGGGFAAPMAKVIDGGNPTTTNIIPDNGKVGAANHEESGARTKKVMGVIMTNFIGQDPDTDMVNLTTGGIHVFGGLPNHPSLDKLKEGNDPAAAMEEHLLAPGREMAAKDMELKLTQVLFDKQLAPVGDHRLKISGALRNTEKGEEMLTAAYAKRPTVAMTPKELKTLIDATLKPLTDYHTKLESDLWKAEQIAAGKPPSASDLSKNLKKYEKWAETRKEKLFDNNIINALDPPEFVIADTNWGDADGHTFFVVIPDPVSGEPKMFQRQDPSGKLTALGDEWLDTNWQVTQ